MLPSKYRLSVYFFKKITKEKKDADKIISLKYFSGKIYFSSNPFSRFAVVANSSYFKRATLRNRLRRIVYEILRKRGFFKKPGKDVVIILKPQIFLLNQVADRKELEEEIGRIFLE